MSQYAVTFSVVTYNSGNYIGRLLDSIAEHVTGVDYHIYVIDNGSVDDTVSIVEARAPQATLIRLKKNIGFGAAHNMALDALDSTYHVIVNPDIFIGGDVIAPMAAYLDAHPDVGMLSPRILFPDGRPQPQAKRDPKLIYLASRRIGLGCLKKYRDRYEMTAAGDEYEYDIEFASGCFMFMRTALFKKTGGFDPRYFLYFEDADLSRALRRYARIVYDPRVFVYHSWERGGANRLGLLVKQIVSMFKYLRKWRKA